MTNTTNTNQSEQHRHEFFLTEKARGRDTGCTIFVGRCVCGATESVVRR